jgi:hypothetical protein
MYHELFHVCGEAEQLQVARLRRRHSTCSLVTSIFVMSACKRDIRIQCFCITQHTRQRIWMYVSQAVQASLAPLATPDAPSISAQSTPTNGFPHSPSAPSAPPTPPPVDRCAHPRATAMTASHSHRAKPTRSPPPSLPPSNPHKLCPPRRPCIPPPLHKLHGPTMANCAGSPCTARCLGCSCGPRGLHCPSDHRAQIARHSSCKKFESPHSKYHRCCIDGLFNFPRKLAWGPRTPTLQPTSQLVGADHASLIDARARATSYLGYMAESKQRYIGKNTNVIKKKMCSGQLRQNYVRVFRV